MPTNPFRAIDDRPVMHPYHARRYAKSIGQEVPLDQAVGRVAAEEVEVYPPGIPVILEGFRVSEDAVRYLREARDLGGAIVARDTSLRRCGCCSARRAARCADPVRVRAVVYGGHRGEACAGRSLGVGGLAPLVPALLATGPRQTTVTVVVLSGAGARADGGADRR